MSDQVADALHEVREGSSVLPTYRGWVGDDDPPVYCDACHRRVWVWELHHLVPIAWGGSDSRAIRDWYVVWVKLCGDCHNTCHLVLDRTRDLKIWSDAWLADVELTQHPGAWVAHWGWNLAVHQGKIAA